MEKKEAKSIKSIIPDFKGFKKFDDEKKSIDKRLANKDACPKNKNPIAKKDGNFVCREPPKKLNSAEREIHRGKVKLGRSQCNKNAKGNKKTGEVCQTKVFKPTRDAPRYGTQSIETTLNMRIKSSIDRINEENAKLPAEAPKWKPMVRNVRVHTANGKLITKPYPVISQSENARSKKDLGTKKAPHLGWVIATRQGKTDQMYSSKRAGQNKQRAYKQFEAKEGLTELSREVLSKAQQNIKGDPKYQGEGTRQKRQEYIAKQLKEFKAITDAEKKSRTGVKIGMNKDEIKKAIANNVREKLTKEKLI